MREKEKEKNRNLVEHFSQVKDLKEEWSIAYKIIPTWEIRISLKRFIEM